MGLTPKIYGAAFIFALCLGLFLWGRSSGVGSVRPRLNAAVTQAEVARLETKGAQDVGRRSLAQAHLADQAAAVASDVATDLSHSETAHAPLDPDRRDRLRRADQRLCQLNPDLAGCGPSD